MSYSNDLRKRALKFVDEGGSIKKLVCYLKSAAPLFNDGGLNKKTRVAWRLNPE